MTYKGWIVFMAAWLIVFLMSLVVDGVQGNMTNLNTILQFDMFKTGFSVFGFRVPIPNATFFSAMFGLNQWGSSMFSGVGQWLRLVLLTMTAGGVFAALVAIGPVINAAIGNIISAIRLIPFLN